jgi:F-type H+-transporting ATPase subunit gamma
MATLRDIRRRISGVKSTAKITQAMRMVSAAKLRRAQNAIFSARPYVEKMENILENLIGSVGENYSHPLLQKHKDVRNIAVIVITADRGMCGSFNTNLLRYAVTLIDENLSVEHPQAKFHVIPVGKRSVGFFKKEKYSLPNEYSGIFQNLQFSTAKSITDISKAGFISGEFDKIIVVYNKFKNLIQQIPSSTVLLPIATDGNSKDVVEKFRQDYIFEPSIAEILDELIPKNLDIQVWRSLLESNAAEQAARMMAMENATNNANDLIRYLELVYNKVRQASITTEMLEIVSGAEALQKS